MCDELRVATALCALKFKPAEQTIHCKKTLAWLRGVLGILIRSLAYVLDLRAKFPSSLPSPPSDVEGSWRTYALDLEQQLATLQRKYEAEKIST